MQTSRSRRITPTLIALGVLVAACSDDGSDAATPTSAAGAATTAEATTAPSTAPSASAPESTDSSDLDPGSSTLAESPVDDNELEEVTPLVANVLAPPRQVLGDDDQIHLAYELFVTNPTSSAMQVDQLEILGPDDEPIGELTGDALQSAIQYLGGQDSIGAAQTFRIFVDQTFPEGAELPESLSHRFTVTLTPDDGSEASSATVVSGATQVVADDAIVVGAPLEGDNWIVGGMCCFPPSYHRTATLPVNGQFHAPERYAIDFVQLNDGGTLYNGPEEDLSSWAYYGAEIFSVADGTVVRIQDDLPEQTPGSFAPGATAASAGGNYVVVDIGDGHYAFYAHLQPGSLTVAEGDEVEQGDVLGLLGNTGNSDGPHLHFHVMDGPGPLSSNGLPFRFESFDVEGTLTNIDDVVGGAVAEIDDTLSGSFEDAMPLQDQVIAFAGSSSSSSSTTTTSGG